MQSASTGCTNLPGIKRPAAKCRILRAHIMEQSATCPPRMAVGEKVMHEFDESAHFTAFIVSGVYWILRRERRRAEKTIRREADAGRDVRQSVTVGQTCQSASLTKSWFTESERILTQADRANANQCHGPSGVLRRPAVGNEMTVD